MSGFSEDARDARYIVGLDIGDGESALAWSSTSYPDSPKVYQRQRTAERSILTATARQDSGYLFGEQAVLAKDAVQFRINFKGHKNATDVLLFGQALLSEFFEANPDVQERCLVFVGHPAGWPHDVVRVYQSHLEFLAPSVNLLSESQSALVYVRDRNAHRSEALDNVLVVDIGSSTVDFTIVEDMIPRNIPVGAELGCNQIDRQLAAMVKVALAGNPDFTAALASPRSEDFLLLACRRAKEAQFSGRRPSLLDIRLSHDPAYSPIADTGFGWLREQDIPSIVLQPEGWANKFEQLVTEVRKNLRRSPDAVILTGGGSRMPFTYDICQLTFHDSAVDRDPDPSLSVARGLASAGRQRVHALRFRDDIRAIVTAAETRPHIQAETEVAFGKIRDYLAAEMRYKEREVWPNLITDPPKKDEVIHEFQSSISAYLVPRAQRICAEYGIDSSLFGINFMLPQLIVTEITNNASRVSTAMDEISGAAANVTGQVAWEALTHSTRASWLPGIIVMAALEGGKEWYRRNRDIKKLLAAVLPPDAAERLTDDILTAMTDEMDKRANAVERFVM
jgi:hypothetical protein